MKRFMAALAVVAMLALVPAALAASDDVSLDDVFDYARDYTDMDVQRIENEDLDCVIVDLSPDSDHYVWLVYQLSGTQRNILGAVLYSDTEYYCAAEDERDEANALTNQWNYDHRYPTAFVDPTDGQYMADAYLFCVDPSEGMVREFVENQIFGSQQLLQFLGESGVPQYAPYA